MKEFFVINNENQKLKTFIYENKNSDIAVIMCHGFSGSSSGIMSPHIAKALCEKYLVCRFDFRGQGESDGKFYDSSISNELEDLKVIVNYIKKEYSPKKIILLGHSFGVAIAMLYSQIEKINGIVSLSGEGDLEKAINYEFSEKQLNEFEKNGEILYENWSNDGKLELLGKQFLDDMKKYSTIEVVKSIKFPILFIHGNKDYVIPNIASKEIFRIVKSDKELVILDSVNHIYNVFENDLKLKEMIGIVLDWIERKF